MQEISMKEIIFSAYPLHKILNLKRKPSRFYYKNLNCMILPCHKNQSRISPNDQKQVNSSLVMLTLQSIFFSLSLFPGMLPVTHSHIFSHNYKVLKKRKCDPREVRQFSRYSKLNSCIHLVHKYSSAYPPLNIVLGFKRWY